MTRQSDNASQFFLTSVITRIIQLHISFEVFLVQDKKWLKLMNLVMDKEQVEKIIHQTETLASTDIHPKWQYLRSAVLRSTKDKGQNTILLVKSRLKNQHLSFFFSKTRQISGAILLMILVFVFFFQLPFCFC
jgi:hypothetical protein